MRPERPRSYECLVLDLDGTLYHAGAPIPGAAEAVARLRAGGLTLRFATNTYSTPAAAIRERLAGFGIPVAEGELLTPHEAFAAAVAARPGARYAAFVNPAIRGRYDYVPERDDPEPEVLLLGDGDEDWSYGALDRLLGWLCRGAELWASSASRTFYGKDGRLHLDTGALVALLEAASGATARIMGKPSAELGRAVAASAGARPERMLVVGDDPAVDMALARAIGADSVLVGTGKGAMARREPEPSAFLASVAELPAWLGL